MPGPGVAGALAQGLSATRSYWFKQQLRSDRGEVRNIRAFRRQGLSSGGGGPGVSPFAVKGSQLCPRGPGHLLAGPCFYVRAGLQVGPGASHPVARGARHWACCGLPSLLSLPKDGDCVRTELSLPSVTANKPGRSRWPTRWPRRGSRQQSAYLHSSLAFMRAMKE